MTFLPEQGAIYSSIRRLAVYAAIVVLGLASVFMSEKSSVAEYETALKNYRLPRRGSKNRSSKSIKTSERLARFQAS
jgi:hypothetical protein